MAGVVGDINPKTMESAKRQFVELYGSALVMNTYLKIALVLVSLVALGLIGLNIYTVRRYADVKPLVIRIDDVGRAEAVQYDATTYKPQAPELRYFLTQFVVKHFSRIRSTLQREYAESLKVLDEVYKVDPEDLQLHYTAMLAHRGLGNAEAAAREEKLFQRFKAEESAQAITGDRRLAKPEENNERQQIHEHETVPLPNRAKAILTSKQTKSSARIGGNN